jgi:hypothetical protein
MKHQNNNFVKSLIERIKNGNRLMNMDQTKAKESLIAISKVVFAFSLLFIGAFVFKLFNLSSESTKHFKLVISNSGLDILPLYKSSIIHFICIITYEIIKLLVVAVAFLYFIKFLKSIDIADPFKNVASKEHIVFIASLSYIFFAIDALSAIHLNYIHDMIVGSDSLRLFNFEFLFMAYFINVFAFVFKKGVDLKNEIDLVI